MIHTNSSLIPLNITAGTILIQEGYHTIPHDISGGLWWVDDTLFVYGNLTWDNGAAMVNMTVNITVQLLSGGIIAFNDTVVTDQWGGFNASGSIQKRIGRFILGIVGVVGIFFGLSMIFPSGISPLALSLRFIRYGTLGFWVSYLGPRIFVALKLA